MHIRYIFSIIFLLILFPVATLAQTTGAEPVVIPEGLLGQTEGVPQVIEEEFYRGEVVEITNEYQETLGLNGTQPYFQELLVRLSSGPRSGEEVTIEYGTIQEQGKLAVGDQVVVVNPSSLQGQEQALYVFEKFRLPLVGALLGLFALLAVVFAGWRGITSLVGLAASIGILGAFAVPQIVDGKNPLVIGLISAAAIAIISIYLAHGISRRTSVAVGSTLLTVVIAVGLAVGFVSFLNLTGTGSEEAYFLQTSPIQGINLQGLLLAAIIIGALGVLDDITTAQSAAVEEISKANPSLSKHDLFTRGMSVGREHITSLVNTLALAYVGASLPALLLFTVYQRPFWVVANTEAITEEVVRTLVGSIALMVAVPITTYLAALFLKQSETEKVMTTERSGPSSTNSAKQVDKYVHG